MKRRNRFSKTVATAAGAALLVFAFGMVRAQADTVIRVGKAFAGVFDFVPVDVGMAQDFFKKHGLDFTEADFGGSAKLQQALAADAIDIGLGSGV
jgi:ABC-type nitrate/sulfonate/bicarbonate transport system substrate-binding protein